jgi:hypothetical protein
MYRQAEYKITSPQKHRVNARASIYWTRRFFNAAIALHATANTVNKKRGPLYQGPRSNFLASWAMRPGAMHRLLQRFVSNRMCPRAFGGHCDNRV